MEFHIEQVLYRDQRTIKTRYFNDCRNHHHHHQQQQQQQSEETKFLPQSHHQQHLISVADDALSIQGVSKSSLYYFNNNNNCHNQYFSKFKRLFYQTEVPCDSEGAVRYTEEISEKKRVRNGSWYKKFHNVLLVSTYLSLITFPYIGAVPTTISSRSKGPSYGDMKVTALTHAYRSAKSAVDRAVDLKNKFREKSDSDPDVIYNDTKTYNWLPQLPKPSKCCFKDHLATLELDRIILDLYTHIQTIRVPIDQLEKDFKDDAVLGRNISDIRGSLDNIIEDINVALVDNNISVPDPVSDDIMPDDLKNLNRTDRALRDWLFIRTLVEILEYTIAVFNHFDVPF